MLLNMINMGQVNVLFIVKLSFKIMKFSMTCIKQISISVKDYFQRRYFLLGIFSDPSFLFYLDFLSRKLSFLCSLYFCSGYHLQFGVLRVFLWSGIIYCEYRVFRDNVLFIFPVQEAKFFMFYLFLFRISLKVWSVKGLSWTGILYCEYSVPR